MVHILSQKNSIANHFLAELRDVKIQQDSMRFRRNLERLGEIFAYEVSKEFKYQSKEVKTPLGTAKVNLLENQPVLATILRAGIPFHQGLLNYFDQAPNAFIAAYRLPGQSGGEEDSKDDVKIEVKVNYNVSPDINNKNLIIIDPMLATGTTIVLALNGLLKNGIPAHTHIVSVLGSRAGIDYLQKSIKNFTIWLGDFDEELNKKAYIVPGLGDAGDLAYGYKT
ncbi:MAG: uracil phosphoribosyltransferase [Cytophagales bacterium]|nr:uracil phosphoribosyltransferase [Cytophagales bacterium]